MRRSFPNRETPEMALIEWDDLARRVNEDGEFRLASRFWDARLRLDPGYLRPVLEKIRAGAAGAGG